jgi:hypothetical protein
MPMKRSRRDNHADQVERLLAEADALPQGPTRIELCEEAVRIADSHNDPGLAYRAREELVDSACFGGRPDLLIVGFSWCLSMFDNNGADSDISPYQVLWRMKWVVGALAKFPQIELATMQGMLDDMERRFRDHSGSTQPVVGMRRAVALQTGDLAAAAKYHKKFMGMERSFLSDCLACERDALADYWICQRKNALGVRKAEELILSGLSCSEIPDSTYGDILLPMVRLRRAEEAMDYHRIGYRRIRRRVADLARWGMHIAYLALTGNDARAIRLFQTHVAEVESAHDPLSCLTFWRTTSLAVESLAERKKKTKLRLPAESPLANASGEYALDELAGKLRARGLELSRQFDRRNGNKYYEELMDEVRTLHKCATRVPFSGS